MEPRRAAACARCGKAGKPRRLNELLHRDKNQPVIVLCDQCVRSLEYADASTWKWFRDIRDRLISSQDKS